MRAASEISLRDAARHVAALVDGVEREVSGLTGLQGEHEGLFKPSVDDAPVEQAMRRVLAVHDELDAVEVGDGGILPANGDRDACCNSSREATPSLAGEGGAAVSRALLVPTGGTAGDGAANGAADPIAVAATPCVPTTTVRPGLTAVVESSLALIE